MGTDTDSGLFILQCPCGHEWAERLSLPMHLGAAVSRMKGMDCCPKCGRKRKAVMLQGDAFKEAKKRLTKVPA